MTTRYLLTTSEYAMGAPDRMSVEEFTGDKIELLFATDGRGETQTTHVWLTDTGRGTVALVRLDRVESLVPLEEGEAP